MVCAHAPAEEGICSVPKSVTPSPMMQLRKVWNGSNGGSLLLRDMHGLDPRDARSKNCVVANVLKPERQLVALREWVNAYVIDSWGTEVP